MVRLLKDRGLSPNVLSSMGYVMAVVDLDQYLYGLLATFFADD